MAFGPFVPVVGSINYKGGVGKTTSSRVAAQGFADEKKINGGKPVLIVDMDPQANTSRRWHLVDVIDDSSVVPKPHPDLLDGDSDLPTNSSICDIWLDLLGVGSTPYPPVPYQTNNPMIHVVPVNENLLAAAGRLSEDKLAMLNARMVQWLRSPELAETYCCVLLDTQPTKSPLIDAALSGSTHVYIPFIPEPQALDGVLSMISYVALHQQRRTGDVPLRLLGLLPNMVSKTVLHDTILRAVESNPNYGKLLMPVKLARRIGYAETDNYHASPDQVTDLRGTNIELEARKFVRYIWGEIEKDLPTLGHGEQQ